MITHLENYKQGLVVHMKQIGQRQLDIVERYCVETTGSPIPLIFFTKLQADIYRYLTEATILNDKLTYSEKAEEKYEAARQFYGMLIEARVMTKGDSNSTGAASADVIEALALSLSLNYAVFLFEQKNERKKALRVLKKQLQEALDDFDKWKPEDIPAIKQQVELIQENINLWKDQGVETDSEEEN